MLKGKMALTVAFAWILHGKNYGIRQKVNR